MIYLDASVLFSLYCPDSNSMSATSLIAASKSPLLLSTLCEFETVNAFSLAIFRNALTDREALQARLKLERNIDAGAYQVRTLPDTAFQRARTLATRLTSTIGVRAADLLHIAIALERGAKSLYTFDLRQRTAALSVGLQVN